MTKIILLRANDGWSLMHLTREVDFKNQSIEQAITGYKKMLIKMKLIKFKEHL